MVIRKNTCAITNVTQPLLCEGKLMRGGWWPSPGDKGRAQRHMYIKHLESDLKVPMFFRFFKEGNNTCVRAQIFRVGGDDCAANQVCDSRARTDCGRRTVWMADVEFWPSLLSRQVQPIHRPVSRCTGWLAMPYYDC